MVRKTALKKIPLINPFLYMYSISIKTSRIVQFALCYNPS